jgi:hypothetical protein
VRIRPNIAQKRRGGSTIQFFDPEMQHTVTARAVLEATSDEDYTRGNFFFIISLRLIVRDV